MGGHKFSLGNEEGERDTGDLRVEAGHTGVHSLGGKRNHTVS